jgi:uncharacterized protein
LKAIILTILLTLVAILPALGQGYDCRRSRTAAEVVICDSDDLSRLDRRLNRAYARSNTPVWRQRAWLRSRNACGVSRECIRRHYLRRLGELRGE